MTDADRGRPIRRLAIALLLLACGGEADAPERPAGTPDSVAPRGTSLVVGSSLDDWALLSVPRDGGVARVRSVRDPSRVVWEGETRLPPAEEVHLLEGPLVVLRTSGGGVHRYDPRADSLARVGEVPPGARWSAWGAHGTFADPEGTEILEIGPDGAWRYEVSGRPRWAGPVEGGRIATLLARSGEDAEAPSLWMLGRGQSEPVARADAAYAPPALVTAWGKRLAAVSPGGEELRFVTIPELTPSDGVGLGGPVRALVGSPSGHEIYAGVGSPPRLLRVNRFVARAEEMAALEREVRAIRPAVLGSYLLVDDGGAPLWVPLDGGDPRRLEGEWRTDLPLGAPDGRVLLAAESGVRVWDPEGGGEPRSLEVPSGLWWGAVRWNPAPPTVVSGRVAEEEPPAGRAAAPGAPPGDTADGASAAAGGAAPPDTAAAPGPGGEAGERGEVPAGHYVVVAAARDADGVRRLLDRLGESGWPTEMQEHRDDAGKLWHRGMVGPYESRGEAEAAARQLRRERGMSVWITEIRAGTPAGEILQ